MGPAYSTSQNEVFKLREQKEGHFKGWSREISSPFFKFMGSQVFTTPGGDTFNWPASVTQIIAEAIGGAGGSGTASGNPSTGGGGKGGGYSKKTINKGAESSLSTFVGSGGISNNSGQSCEVTQGVTVVLRASGGAGGSPGSSNSTNGAGATGIAPGGTAIGDVTFAGGNGGTGNFTSGVEGSGAGGGAAGPLGVGGNASVNVAGTGAGGLFNNGVAYSGNGATGVGNSTPGVAGNNYGGAASGGKANANTDRAGASGAQGIIVITWPETYDIFHHLTQYRFFEDNSATETSLTALGTLSSALSLDLTSEADKDFMIRVEVETVNNTFSPEGGDKYTLQVSKNGGTFADIAPGEVVEPRLSSNYTDNQVITADLLVVGGKADLNGKFSESGVLGPYLVSNEMNFTNELMYSIRVKASLLANGDVVTFQLKRLKNGFTSATQVFVNDVTPTLNIVKSGGGGPVQNSNFFAFF